MNLIILMKTPRIILALLTAIALIAITGSATAVEKNDGKDAKKAKPYPLKTCLVSDEPLDADPNMKSFTLVHEGQEIKLCCKSCLKDFKKDSTKLLKKMKEVAAKEAAKSAK